MSPNINSRINCEIISPKQCMKMSKSHESSGNSDNGSNYVPMDRLLDIAKQLAELELSNTQFIDNCVSLLDTKCQIQTDIDVEDNKPLMEKKSVDNNKNYCEVVSVPTSTHVAQIVGKQGSKIKLLRAKSGTYIQTPVSGEEPVFIITGRREDVLKVKEEILSASEHFSAISEERERKLKQNSDIPGSVSMNLIIPSFLIGLIVGRNGNTIRNIQKMTETYIETPKIIENSSFKISGHKSNVLAAKELIIEHVKSKTNRNFKTQTQPNGDIKLNFDE